jgi:nitroreductase
MVRELLLAASMAPSAWNCQPCRFVVIKSLSCKEQLGKLTPQPFVTRAPLIIVACIDRRAMSAEYLKQRTNELINARSFFVPPTSIIDPDIYANKNLCGPEVDRSFLNLNAAIAVDQLTLRAVDLGLGVCWVMQFENKKVKDILSLGDRYEPFVLLPVGFPAEKPKPRPRLSMRDILLKEII